MKKIPTLFVRDPKNMKLVTQEINPECEWIISKELVATIKKDGTNIAVQVQDGKVVKVLKRRNPTREEKSLGAEPGYIDAYRNDLGDQYIFAAVDATDFSSWPNGQWSCEALGPKIQGGIESDIPCLYAFSVCPTIIPSAEISANFDDIKEYLGTHEIEGIVWYTKGEFGLIPVMKIKRRDFDFHWPVKK